MKLLVAGTEKEFEDNITVKELIELEKIESPEYVTVSVNDEFVDQKAFEGHKLNDGDQIEFLYFMGGGR
jgi:sulfur carrier protein